VKENRRGFSRPRRFFLRRGGRGIGGASRFFKRIDREKWGDSPKFCGFAGNFRAFRPKRFFCPDLKNKIADV